MYGAPLGVIGQVIRTKSVEFMPLPLTVTTFLCSIVWCSFAVYVRDMFMGVPNVIGIALAIAQLVLYGAYRPGGPLALGPAVLAKPLLGKDAENPLLDH